MEREERSTVVYNARFKFPRCKLEREISIPAGLKGNNIKSAFYLAVGWYFHAHKGVYLSD